MARKGRCPRCAGRMKLASRYCTKCGGSNPLLVAPRPRRAPAAVKSAGSGYAPVVPLRTGVPGRDPRWSDILGSPDPDARAQLFAAYFPDGGGAA
jgi:hypothetical protein